MGPRFRELAHISTRRRQFGASDLGDRGARGQVYPETPKPLN